MRRAFVTLLALALAFVPGIVVDRSMVRDDDAPTATSEPRTTDRNDRATPTAGDTDSPALRRAEEKVRALGYCPTDATEFGEGVELQVLIGEAFAGASGYFQQAFFFVDDRFVGRDAEEGSQGIEMAWRSDTTVALRYTLWKPDDPHCCPTGGAKTARFEWDGSRVAALDELPPGYSADVSTPYRYSGFSPKDNELREPPCTY